jgi:ATP-binding cassette subfamily B protein
MHLIRTYARALSLLAAERELAILLAVCGIVLGLVQLAEPILFGKVVDALSKGREAFPLIALWAGLGLFSILASVVVAIASDRLAHRQRMAALSNGFERAITLPVSYHARRGSGAIIRSLLAGTDALFGVWLTFLREHLVAIVSIALLVPTAILLKPVMALILGALALIYFVVNVLVIYRTNVDQTAIEHHHQSVFGRVGDVVGNVTVVQSYVRLAAETEALRSLAARLLAAQYPVLTWWGLLTVVTRAAATITMVAVFAVGAVLASRGETTVGEIVTFVGFSTLLIAKLDQLSGFVARIFVQTPTLRSYFDLMDTTGAIEEKAGAIALPPPRGAVRYENVTFSFPDSDLGVFDLSFEAEPGQTIALVGPTGSGKTTTLALLQRLRDPASGRILVDGHDIRDVTLASLRHAISVVFQDAGLFNRSIAENIGIGRPGATDAEIREAARLAEAHEFIEAKPGGYEFVIGERGAALSGGERQRLAIARAILKAAPILVLDEATSALDNETEAKVKRALEAVRRERTTFIIAHRLSTVRNADLILVLDKGRIVERGRFDELATAGGLFSRLVEAGDLRPPLPEGIAATVS